MFDKMKGLFDMQKKAKQMKKELAEAEVNVERLDSKIKMTFSGEYNMKDLYIDGELLKEENKDLLEDNLKQAINEASGKIKTIMMDKMKASMGGINLPGMGM